MRTNFETQSYYWIKDLNKAKRMGVPLEQTLMIDNIPSKLERQYGNLIPINSFVGEPEDRELLFIQKALLNLKDVPNVRTIEKRWWWRDLV